MAYRYHSRRSARKLARQSKRNFLITLFLIGLLGYATITWALPSLITGIGFVKDKISPSQKVVADSEKNSSVAPPVLNIPYEATNTAQITISGYSTPNSKVNIFLDDGNVGTSDVLPDGSFEIKNIRLVLGTNNIYAKALDEEGLESLPSKTIKVIYDNEKPSLTVNEPEDNKIIEGENKVKISGSTEVGAKVFINDSQVIVDKEGNFSSVLNLNEGENIFTVKGIDSASNMTENVRRVILKPQEP